MPVANTIFQDDNARPNRARFVDDFLRTKNVNWPAMSPDLSCIGHVWDVVGRRAVSVRLERNSTLQDLRRFLRLSENSCNLQRTMSVNAGIIMVVTHTIKHYIEFWDTSLVELYRVLGMLTGNQ